jgi:hypothetical protein
VREFCVGTLLKGNEHREHLFTAKFCSKGGIRTNSSILLSSVAQQWVPTLIRDGMVSVLRQEGKPVPAVLWDHLLQAYNLNPAISSLVRPPKYYSSMVRLFRSSISTNLRSASSNAIKVRGAFVGEIHASLQRDSDTGAAQTALRVRQPSVMIFSPRQAG